MKDDIYDITPIPHVPFEPGPLLWLVPVVLLLGVVLLLYRRSFTRRRTTPFAFAVEEMGRLIADRRATREKAEAVSLLARRYLAGETGAPFESYTGVELTEEARRCEDPVLGRALLLTAQLSEASWEPAPTAVEEQGRELMHALAAVDAAKRSGTGGQG